jgi:tripartite ATP-independent transporter DctP family solute receptor
MRSRIVFVGCLLIALLSLTGAANAQITLRFGHQNAPDHSTHLGALKFAELVAQKTNGQVKVVVFPSSQLGGLNALWTGAKVGTIDIAGGLPATVAMDLAPSTGIFDAPYMFTGVEHFRKVWTGPIGQEIFGEFPKKVGVRVLFMQSFGTRHLTANKKILHPDDLKGLKIRAVSLPVFMSTVEGLGATPTPLEFAELYQGLLTGVVDGQENPAGSIVSSRFYEVQKYLMLTGHIFASVAAMMNEDTFRRLKPEHQKALIEAGLEASAYGDQVAVKQEADAFAKLKSGGMTVIGPEDGLDLEAFRTRVRATAIPKLSAQWPAGLHQRVLDAAK